MIKDMEMSLALGIGASLLVVLSIVLMKLLRSQSKITLKNNKRVHLTLTEKRSVSDDTYVFQFALSSQQQTLGVPVGQHIRLVQQIKTDSNPEGVLIERKYTPISKIDEKGIVELLIKVYRPNIHPNYPEGGKMSYFMEGLKVGDKMAFEGPVGRFRYLGNGQTQINNSKQINCYKRINMIAGGSGITPMYQIIQAVLDNCQDKTQLSLLFANKSQNDILLQKELESYKQMGLQLAFTLDQPEQDWKYHKGFINNDMLNEMHAADEGTLNLLCGPFPMLKMVTEQLKQLGHKDKNIFKF